MYLDGEGDRIRIIQNFIESPEQNFSFITKATHTHTPHPHLHHQPHHHPTHHPSTHHTHKQVRKCNFNFITQPATPNKFENTTSISSQKQPPQTNSKTQLQFPQPKWGLENSSVSSHNTTPNKTQSSSSHKQPPQRATTVWKCTLNFITPATQQQFEKVTSVSSHKQSPKCYF